MKQTSIPNPRGQQQVVNINNHNTFSGLVTRLNRNDAFEPLIMPGQFLRIQIGTSALLYRLPRDRVVQLLPPLKKNISDSIYSTSPLAVYSNTSNGGSISATKIEAYNMDEMDLGHYKLVVIDKGIDFTLSQPSLDYLHKNTDGSLPINYENTMPFYYQKLYSMLPEVFTLGTKHSFYLSAINKSTFNKCATARIMMFGFRYSLEPVPKEKVRIIDGTLYYLEKAENDKEKLVLINAPTVNLRGETT